MTDLKPIIFADLDDTLFQTVRKMSEPPDEARLASCATNGSHSYMTLSQAATVAWLLETTRLIPTTARSSEVLKRTTIGFCDYKICSNGGAIILPTGGHDPDWATHVANISQQHSAAFEGLQAAVSDLVSDGLVRSWLVYEAETPVYFVAKISAGSPEDALHAAQAACKQAVGSDLVFHRNARNMSLTPKGLTKIDAVNELIKRLPNTDKRPIWGMGDSISDLPFMRSCQMMVIPSDSQISETHLQG